MDVHLAVSDAVRGNRHQMVLPHFDPVGKPDDAEAVLGPKVMEDGEQGIFGLGKHRTRPVTSGHVNPRVPQLGDCTPGAISGGKLSATCKWHWMHIKGLCCLTEKKGRRYVTVLYATQKGV